MHRLMALVRRAVPHSWRARLPERWRRVGRDRRDAASATTAPPAPERPTSARPTLRDRKAAAAEHSKSERWPQAAAAWQDVLDTTTGVPDARTYVQLARAQRQVGQLAEATATVRTGQQHHPDDHTLMTEQAQLAVADEDWGVAAELWQTLIREADDGADPRNYTRLIRARRRDGDLVGATVAATEGRDRFPDHTGIACEHAQLASSARDWPEAVARWRRIVESTGDRAPARAFLQLGKALAHQGQLGEAAEVVDRGAELHPHDTELRERQAKLAVTERDWDRAAERWRAVIDADPDAAGPVRYRTLARVLTEGGHHDEADEALRRGLDVHPDDPRLLAELAYLAAGRTDWDEAQRRWATATAKADLTPQQWCGFAQRCAGGFQHDLADEIVADGLRALPGELDLLLQHVRNAITRQRRERAPDEWDWSEAHARGRELLATHAALAAEDVERLVTLLADASAIEEAIAMLDVVLQREEDPALQTERTELEMALCRWDDVGSSRPIGALEDHGDADRRSIVLSRAHQARGDLDAALEAVERLRTTDPRRWSHEVARARTAVGDHAGAVEAWLRAREANPQSTGLARHTAVAHRRVGDDDAARGVAEEAGLERNPGVVAIIGGGPSLKGVDLEPLRGVAHCVAVNATATMLPWCDVAVTHDPSHLIERFLGFPGLVVAGLPAAEKARRGRVPGFEFRRRFVTDRLSELDDVVHSGGHTSAHTALNYAYLLRPTRIVLFGVDLTDFWGPDDYWHGSMDAYNRRRFQALTARPIYEEWHEYRSRKLRNAPAVFASTVEQLEHANIEVWNASPASSVTCFPRIEPTEGVQRCIEDALS